MKGGKNQNLTYTLFIIEKCQTQFLTSILKSTFQIFTYIRDTFAFRSRQESYK